MVAEYKDIIEGSPAHGAIMDDNTTILIVNQSWVEFAKQNGLKDCTYSIGSSYLDVCKTAIHDLYAQKAHDHLKTVVDGKAVTTSFVYPCHSPTEERWFMCKFYKIPGGVLTLHFRER